MTTKVNLPDGKLTEREKLIFDMACNLSTHEMSGHDSPTVIEACTFGATKAFAYADIDALATAIRHEKEIAELKSSYEARLACAKEDFAEVNRWWADKWDCYRKADLGRRNVIAKELDAKAMGILK